MNKLKAYTDVRDLLYEKGTYFPKKHGSWIRLYLNKGYFLSLDTWNGKVLLQEGSGLYNYWTGFSGRAITMYGYEFGGKHHNTNLSDYLFLNDLFYDKWFRLKGSQRREN